MTLHETIQMMKERNSEEKFSQLIEMMIRNADKGLIDGVTSEDIKKELLEYQQIQEDQIPECEKIFPVINELSEAVEAFGFLDDENTEILTESNENFTFGEYIKENDNTMNKTIGELLS